MAGSSLLLSAAARAYLPATVAICAPDGGRRLLQLAARQPGHVGSVKWGVLLPQCRPADLCCSIAVACVAPCLRRMGRMGPPRRQGTTKSIPYTSCMQPRPPNIFPHADNASQYTSCVKERDAACSPTALASAGALARISGSPARLAAVIHSPHSGSRGAPQHMHAGLALAASHVRRAVLICHPTRYSSLASGTGAYKGGRPQRPSSQHRTPPRSLSTTLTTLTMKTTMITSLLGVVAALASGAAAVATPKPQDVWVPAITSPTASTVWHLGQVCVAASDLIWMLTSSPTAPERDVGHVQRADVHQQPVPRHPGRQCVHLRYHLHPVSELI
jgi:hypothetical protein